MRYEEARVGQEVILVDDKWANDIDHYTGEVFEIVDLYPESANIQHCSMGCHHTVELYALEPVDSVEDDTLANIALDAGLLF